MFPVQDMEEKLKKIKQGDRLVREDFLESCRSFVFKTACKYSRRVLVWGRDDELAIALIACNEAIDRYREDSGVPFLAYANLVISSRLADYRRRENRSAAVNVPLPPDGEGLSGAEFAKAWEIYWEQTAARERADEIREFEKLLDNYGISFDELVRCSPRHRDTRRSLTLAARVLAEMDELMEELRNKKKLPLLDLERKTGISRKTLERGRKYIIATSLLIYGKGDFPYLNSYLNLSAPD